jgi:cytosine/adenosine deaminase-related metal-dependent hydrolase
MPQEPADTLINNTIVVSMNGNREVISDATVAIGEGRIIGMGKTADIASHYQAAEVIDGQRFVVTPGLVNTHMHITGEPLTRGFVPEGLSFDDLIHTWLDPLLAMYTEEEERLSAQLSAADMLKSGTTTFLEAGTVKHVDAVVDALDGMGIRARLGKFVWDVPREPFVLRRTTAEAIAQLEQTLRDHRSVAGGRIQAWVQLLGHTTASDELWRAAANLAREWNTGINFHMSHAIGDPERFLAKFNERPFEHLDHLDVLGPNCVATHAVNIDDTEIALLARSGTSVAHCPSSALRCAIGMTKVGRIPELIAAGVNVAIGIDGNNASNNGDMMRATYLAAGLFKDARQDPMLLPAEQAFEMATLNGAKALLSAHEIGSVEVGKRADLVLHDRDRPEWTPLIDVARQLVWSADGRGVHTVFVDGRKVVDNYRITTIDEHALYAAAQVASDRIVARSGLKSGATWPTI